METIRLADGTEIENAWIVQAGSRVFFYIENGSSMTEVCSLMGNPKNTARLESGRNVLEGYTDLFILQKTGNQIGGGLAKPGE